MPNYVVDLPQMHIEADNPTDAADQAIQTFLDYPGSRTTFVREFGTEKTSVCNPLSDPSDTSLVSDR